MTGTGLRGDVGDSLLLGVICLGKGGIQLVASGGRYALILEIDMGRGAKGLLKFVSPHERSTAVSGILLTHFFGDRDPLVGLVEFLVGALLTEDRIKVLRAQRLTCSGMKERQGLVGHDCLDVEKMRRNL